MHSFVCGSASVQVEKNRFGHLNCDLPSVEDMVRDPQVFFRGCAKPVVVFDEIHQLRDPARLLKIGADGFSKLKILATGSSTLAASKKFSDTLTGRKRLVHLTPVGWGELPAFGVTLPQRLFHGGLPPALLASTKQPAFYREWMDSFFARDIQRLFGFRDMNRFNAMLELMLRQSSGQFEVTHTAATRWISSSASGILMRSIAPRSSSSAVITRRVATSCAAPRAILPIPSVTASFMLESALPRDSSLRNDFQEKSLRSSERYWIASSTSVARM